MPEAPTSEDVQDLRESIESLRDHVQIVWQAIDELREVIDYALGSDAPDIWSVEPPQGPPPGRYRPFAGYYTAEESSEENKAAAETMPQTLPGIADVADLPADVACDTASAVAACLRESRGQGGMDSLADRQRHNTQANNDQPAATQQRSLWNDSPTIAEPAAEAAGETSQKEAERAVWFVRPDRQNDFGSKPQWEWPALEHDRDSISVDRIYTDNGITHRFTIRRGDTVDVFFAHDRIETGKAVGISQANQEVRVQFNGRGEGIWFYKGKIYPAKEPASGEPQDAKPASIDNPPAGETYTLDDWTTFRHAFSDGHIDATGIHTEFRRMQAGRQHFIDALVSSKSAGQLKLMAMQRGIIDARRNTKQQNAEAIYRGALAAFTLGEAVTYQPMQETYEEAVERIVLAITDAAIAQQREKHRQQLATREKAHANPETLLEFATFLRARDIDELSDEQFAVWDKLHADRIREDRQNRQRPDTVEQFQADEIEGLEFRIVQGFHEREQVPLHVVQLSSRVERATFNELKRKASQLGGWWSSFKKDTAGFQFRSRESAEKFAGLANSDADRSDELAARKLRKLDNASERLHAV